MKIIKRRRIRCALLAVFIIPAGLACSSFTPAAKEAINVDEQLAYCNSQIRRTLQEIENDTLKIPRRIDKNETDWYLTDVYDWTSGFWPGILWYNYENTLDEAMKKSAIQYTEWLEALLDKRHAGDHDLGFQIFCSFGSAYRLTQDEHFKEIALAGADKLAAFYNPVVGTILSWHWMDKEMGWPHNTIMDNMMNLELLFWASKNGGKTAYYDMAVSHAKVTMENQFREDGTNYHVAIYDTINGNFMKGVTNQGYSDDSFWARGQAWAIYGYTMVYRETGDKTFLRFAEKITDVYLNRLPEDYVPFWDFDDPAIPNAPKDASSAAIVASALLELALLEDNESQAALYNDYALNMIKSLSSEKYLGGEEKPAFLLHSTGNLPAGYEIDASINYADHYYIESLIRLKKINKGIHLSQNLHSKENSNKMPIDVAEVSK